MGIKLLDPACLPSGQTIRLGWAAPIPVLMEVDELFDAQRPQSADADCRAICLAGSAKRLAGDEMSDRLHLVIDGVDGHTHYVETADLHC